VETDQDAAPPPKTDSQMVREIFARYYGKFETLTRDAANPDWRAQLALDLGFLLGLCTRLLDEQAAAKAREAHTPDVSPLVNDGEIR